MIQNEYCIELLVGCTAYMCLWNRWCAMEDEKWMLGEALKSLFPASSIAGPAMQVHCVRSNATQGNTSIYFKQASHLTKNLSNIIKMCSFYFKIVVFYETGIFIKNYLFLLKKKRLDVIKHHKNCECCPGHYLSTSVY